jgi:hypothetical protein
VRRARRGRTCCSRACARSGGRRVSTGLFRPLASVPEALLDGPGWVLIPTWARVFSICHPLPPLLTDVEPEATPKR